MGKNETKPTDELIEDAHTTIKANARGISDGELLRAKLRSLPLRQAFKLAKRHLKRLNREKRKSTQELNKLGTRIDQLKVLAESYEHHDSKSENIYFNTGVKMPFDINGIWIVSERSQDSVVLTSFDELVKNDPKPAKVDLKGILKKSRIGSDGLEVSFNKGDLLVLSNQDLGPEHKGIGIHLANVAPSTGPAQLQYEYALFQLGLGAKPSADVPTVVIDGQFRQQLRKREN